MGNDTLIVLTAKIVSAQVLSNAVELVDLPPHSVGYDALDRSVWRAGVAEWPEPAVPVGSSVKPDAIICLECGAP